MGDINKLITLANLTEYDTLIKQVISEGDAESLHKVLFDSTNKQIKFYKSADATLSDTADFTINIPADLDSSATIASASNGVVTIKAGLSEVDGIVTNNSDSDITLAKVATTGDAEDIDYDNTSSGLLSTKVQAAIDEIAAQSAGGVGSKTIWVEDESAGQSDYAKVYKIYQCATQAEESSTTLKGTINIPRDLFIKAASVETVVTPDVPYEGAVVGDKYIDIEVQNQQAHLYVPCNSLVDEYTAEQGATQIQLAIDANNEISATIVAGSVTATELASDAVTTAKILDANVTTAKIADSNVTTAKIADENVTLGKLASGVQTSLGLADSAVQSVTTSDPTTGTNGTITVDGTEVAVKGLGSAAYTASTAYDAAGTGASEAASAIAALDSNTSAATDTTDSGRVVLTEVGIEDGIITTKKSHTFGTAADCADTDFMKTADYSTASSEDISDLFNS